MDKLTGAYYEHFYAVGNQYAYTNSAPDHSFVLLLLAFFFISYMSVALSSKSGRIAMSFLGSVPVFAGCIAVNGNPEIAVILCLMLFWLLVILSGGDYEPDSGSWKTVFVTAIPIALFLCSILFFFKPSEYEYSDTDVSISQRFDKIGSAISRWMSGKTAELVYITDDRGDPAAGSGEADSNYTAVWTSGGENMELTQSYDYSAVDTLVLRARTDVGGNIYLRSRSYGDYTGTGWLAAESPALSSLGYTAAAVSADPQSLRHQMQIRFVAGSDFLYLPYYSSLSFSSDNCVFSDSQASYELEYSYPAGNVAELSMPTDMAGADLEYRSFAHDYYTRLPDSTRSAMLDIIGSAGLSADSPDLIQQVADYVQRAGTYDLDTQPYPSSDYAVYFFTEAHRGYCVHFATAAAVMYRALGIPARVTEGFLYKAEERQFTDVRGENAHAWVEVYVDALGWIPVEVTGSSGVSNAGDEAAFQPEPSPVSQNADGELSAAEADSPQPSAENSTLPVGVIGSPEQGSGQSSAEKKSFPWHTVILALVIILAAAALPLRYSLLRRLSIRSLSQSDGSKCAVAIWRQARRISAYGPDIPVEISNCAEKASFSLHQISPQELSVCLDLLNNMAEQTYKELKPIKKFVFKYLKGLI